MRAYVSLALVGLAAAACEGGGASFSPIDAATDTRSADAAPEVGQDPDLGPGTPDLGPVSFSAQIQPIFEASCIDATCHDAVGPARGLALTSAAVSLAELVGVASSQCPSVDLVDPGSPDTSYLVWKLEGAGDCFVGRQMPRNDPPLSDDQIALVRGWIAQGAVDT
jgi:hypothetical protein